MSLYGVMRTGVSGMNAQANRLSTVAENVANVNTTGYKGASSEFSSLLLTQFPGGYESGAVLTNVRRHITTQGTLSNSTSLTDLAVSGRGFFLVRDRGGQPLLTRAGNFVPDENGNLVNAAGFNLLGYRLDPEQPAMTVNGYTNLAEVNLEELALTAAPSTRGAFAANLPSESTIVDAANLPSANTDDARYTAKSSLITYDNLGGQVTLDIYFSKMSDGEWEVAVFDSADAAAGGGFPYASGPLTTSSLTFDAMGKPTTGAGTAITVPIPGGQDFVLGLGKLSQLATDYTVLSATANGNAPSSAEAVEITNDGTVYASYEDGSRVAVYRIPLAQVTSPDMLTPLAGNVFLPSINSGDVEIGFAQSGGRGKIVSGALEQSTVDLASELTSMIDAQRSYTANSKVFQTGAELMDVLVNLKR